MAHGITLDLEDYGSATAAPGKSTAHASQPSLMARALTAIRLVGIRRRDAEIGDFIQSNGGRLTDNLEREIGRRFGPGY